LKPFIAFRGLPRSFPDLKTGVQRLDVLGKWTLNDLKHRERRLIETFSVYAGEHLPRDTTDWDVLFLGQHHRLPTRLLDWTASPYVALFFATEDPADDDEDGLIWCVRRHVSSDRIF
jgi:FRG domain-containing protein